MIADILRLTPEGQQTFSNASAGGLLVRATSFAVDDYIGDPPVSVPTELIGAELYRGTLYYVESLSNGVARFTVTIPADAISAGVNIGGIAIYNESILMGYCSLSQFVTVRASRRITFELMMEIGEDLIGALDVTHSTLGSIPSVVSLQSLPSPVDSLSNAVSVLDMTPAAGGNIPGIAIKFGTGGMHWSFVGYTRYHLGTVESVVSESEFFQSTADAPQDNEAVIVQIISGPGAGSTRLFLADTSNVPHRYVSVGTAFPAIADTSVIAMWRSVMSPAQGGFLPFPVVSNVPETWLLARGNDAGPRWVPPPSPGGNQLVGSLYYEPGRLRITSTALITSQDKMRYSLPRAVADQNHCIVSLQGVVQHRAAFDMADDETVEFSEYPPANIQLDMRTFTLDPDTGTRINIHVVAMIGDGITTELPLPVDVTSPEHLLVYAGRALQMINSFVLDQDNNLIRFTEPAPPGVYVECRVFEFVPDVGYSTRLKTFALDTVEPTNKITLPAVPQSKSKVFITENGMLITSDQYAVNNNDILFTGLIAADRNIEILLFEDVKAVGTKDTSLNGVITSAYTSGRNLVFLRHGERPMSIPVPQFVLEGRGGINVKGSFPRFYIESKTDDTLRKDPLKAYSRHERVSNVEEILVLHKVEFKGDISISVTANFAARLGPGFQSQFGLEEMEYVVGYRTISAREPDYGRKIAGTDSAGFTNIKDVADAYAYSNASIGTTINIVASNNRSGYVEVVAKMRVKGAQVNNYGSDLSCNLNVLVLPKL